MAPVDPGKKERERERETITPREQKKEKKRPYKSPAKADTVAEGGRGTNLFLRVSREHTALRQNRRRSCEPITPRNTTDRCKPRYGLFFFGKQSQPHAMRRNTGLLRGAKNLASMGAQKGEGGNVPSLMASRAAIRFFSYSGRTVHCNLCNNNNNNKRKKVCKQVQTNGKKPTV
nr:hypothetical protein [Pandoravirus massiliensis]